MAAKTRCRWGLLAICLLAFALRLYLLEDITLNEDEEKSQLLYVQQPAAQILAHYEPNNHWLTSGLGHLLGQLGRQRFLLRWPSVVFGTLAVPLLGLAGGWLFGSRRIGLLAAFLLALSAFHSYWSQQFRGYSALLFFALLSLLLLYRALQTGGHRYWWGFGGSMALTLASHLYGVLVLITALAIVMRGLGAYQRKNGSQPRWAWLLAAAGLATAGCLLWFGKQAVINLYHPPPPADFFQLIYYQWLAIGPTLPEIGRLLKGLALAFTAHPHDGLAVALLAGLGLTGWILCATRSAGAARFLALWLAIPLGLVITAEFALAGFFVLNRFLIFTLPAWLLLVSGGLATAAGRLAARLTPQGWRRSTAYAGLIALSLGYLSWLNLQALQAHFTTQAGHDWRGVAAYLAGRLEPDDLIICNRLLYRSPPRPDENDGCVLELRRRLAELAAPLDPLRIRAAADLRLPLKNSGSTAGTVWMVVWGLESPLQAGGVVNFERLGQTSLLHMAAGPTLDANLALAVEHLSKLPPPAAPLYRLNADFGSPTRIRLLGYTLPASLHPGQAMPLNIVWQALAPIPADYTIFLHLRNPAGRTVAQLDYRPFEGAYPTSRWLPGSTIAETHSWQLPPDLPPGPYTLHAGLYELQTLARLPVIEGNNGENAVTLGKIWLE